MAGGQGAGRRLASRGAALVSVARQRGMNLKGSVNSEGAVPPRADSPGEQVADVVYAGPTKATLVHVEGRMAVSADDKDRPGWSARGH